MMWTLARASLDGAIVVVAIWVLSRTLALSPSTRTLLWWCAAAKFVIGLAWATPIAIPILPAQPQAAIAAARISRADQVIASIPGESRSAASALRTSGAPVRRTSRPDSASAADRLSGAIREWSSFAALGWIGGLLLLAFVAVRRWSATASLVRGSAPAGVDVTARARDLAARLRLRRVPDVRVSERIETPLVTGLVRPVVLLPGERFTALSERQRDMALCHELAHVKRADLWLGCVPALAERLFFFHPLAHFVSREYSLAREAACDAAVVETLDAAPREYGCLLLALGVSRPQAGAAANAAWSFVHLKRRIAMLQELPPGPRRSRIVAAAAVAVALLALVPLRLVARPAHAAAPSEQPFAAATQDRATAPTPTDVERPDSPQAVETGREASQKDFSFVLLLDGSRTVSGSEQDLQRARSFQRDGDALLWVRRNGREYVIRDTEVLRQARAAWRDFDAGQLAHLIGDQVASAVGIAVDSGMIEHAARLGAEIGGHALEVASEALRNVRIEDVVESLGDLKELKSLEDLKALKGLESLSELRALEQIDRLHDLKHLESLKELEHLRDLQKLETFKQGHEGRRLGDALRELHEALADADHEIDRHLERALRHEVDRHRDELHAVEERLQELAEPLKDLEQPIKDLVEPLAGMGRHLGEMGREIGHQTGRAMEQMRDVIDRAIAAGVAKPVK